MIHIVTGGSSSGKSLYAENMAVRLAVHKKCALVYLATLSDRGEESLLRIERHKKQREGKGFVTIEKSRDIDELDAELCGGKCVVLLEDMTNLLAGYRYLPGKTKTTEGVIADIIALSERVSELIIVTNEITAEIMEEYALQTQEFARELSIIVNRIANECGRVTEVVLGNAMIHENTVRDNCLNENGLHNTRGERMFFVTGAAYSGKTVFARKRFPEKKYINTLDELDEYISTDNELIIDDLHLMISEQMQKGIDVYKYWESYLLQLKAQKAVIIGREMGCGLIPMDVNMRKYLEIYGKTVRLLSDESDEIYRLITGVHHRLR